MNEKRLKFPQFVELVAHIMNKQRLLKAPGDF